MIEIFIFYVIYSLYCVLIVLGCLFMVMKDIDKNQRKMEIRTHDFNVPKDHISRFLLNLSKNVIQNWLLKLTKKKNLGIPITYVLC